MNTEQLLKKYTTYRDNILWHIKTNDPPEHEIKKLNAQADIYLEMIGDLKKLSHPPTPLPVQQAAKEYVKNLQISSASIDPRRDRDRYLGFLAGHSFEEEWTRVEDGLPKESMTVLVYTDQGKIGHMFYSERYGWHSLKGNAKVTHWRLPQPPKTDK